MKASKVMFLVAGLLCSSLSLLAQNLWTQLPNFGGDARYEGFSFSLDTDNDGQADKGYIGGGWNAGTTNYNDFWEYDPATGVWTQKAQYPGLGRRQTATFVLDNIVYVVGGVYSSSSLSNKVWAYDVATNTWTQKNDFPIDVWGSIGFTINGTAFVALGNRAGSVTSTNNTQAVYQYNAANDTWTAKNDVPFTARYMPVLFEIDSDNNGIVDRVFVGCGERANGNNVSDFWEYLPATDSWAQKTSMPGSTRGIARYFSIAGKGYAGLGNNGGVSSDLYEYDPVNDTWVRMSDHPGTATRGALSFSVGNTGYVVCGNTPQGVITQFYKYEPLLYGYSEIRGNVFADGNANCTLDGNEFALANIPVQAFPGPYLTSTDANGDYVFRVPVGNYSVSSVLPAYLGPLFPGINCPAGGTYANITVAALGIDTSGFDFAIEALQCPRLSVEVASSGRVRCFNNITVISYCNYGLVGEDSVYIDLIFPEFVSIDTASEVFTTIDSVTYRFYIGTVAAGACGDILIEDYVSCDDINLLGAAACTEVHIYPANTCLPQDTVWNGANVDIDAICLAGGDTVQITVSNTGSNAMADSSELRIYLDGVLGYTENFLLPQGGSYILLIPSNGVTIMAEADQATGHPYNQHVVTWIERCRVDTLAGPLFTIIPNFPLGDEYEQYDVECLAVSGSFDPNDKQAYPSGIGANNIIPPGTVINYKLRFQNTGTDTARNVYLVDTLSDDLDVATLRVNAASHPYRMELSGVGKTIVTFYFDNIMLPDSNVNQLGSNGFVSFSIAPKANTPLGTVVENFADIYFDFNPPVRTNTVLQTVDVLPVDLIGIREGNTIIILDVPNTQGKQQLYLFPNPVSAVLNIALPFPASGQAEVMVADLLGRVVATERYYGTAGSKEVIGLDMAQLNAGVYVVVVNLDGELTTGKLIKE